MEIKPKPVLTLEDVLHTPFAKVARPIVNRQTILTSRLGAPAVKYSSHFKVEEQAMSALKMLENFLRNATFGSNLPMLVKGGFKMVQDYLSLDPAVYHYYAQVLREAAEATAAEQRQWREDPTDTPYQAIGASLGLFHLVAPSLGLPYARFHNDTAFIMGGLGNLLGFETVKGAQVLACFTSAYFRNDCLGIPGLEDFVLKLKPHHIFPT